MPGSVENAAPIHTLPAGLAVMFSRGENYPVLRNVFPSGDSVRGLLGYSTRSSWQQTRRGTPTETEALRDFFVARQGPLEPFYFVDEFGVTKTVRFVNEFNQVLRLGRGEVSFELIQLA